MTKKIQLSKYSIKSNFSGKNHYDLVIIGAGISGLSTALMWMKNTSGKKTLILEKNDYAGGYNTAFQRGDYVFETTQLFPDIIDMMEYLGIKIRLKQYQNDFMRRIVVNGDRITEYKIPAGVTNFTDYLKKTFPEDSDKIDKLMEYSVSMFSRFENQKLFQHSQIHLLLHSGLPKSLQT